MKLHDWRKNGQISVWTYEPDERNYPGWHIGADASGYESLREILLILSQSPIGSKRTIELDLSAKRYAAIGIRKNLAQKIVLLSASQEDQWVFRDASGKFVLKVSAIGVSALLESISRAQGGEYDFCIKSANGQRLWFW